MKRIILMMLCAMFTFSLVYAQDTKKKNKKETVTFQIEEMDCDHCVKKIEKNISYEKGVTDLKCDLPARTVTVTFRTDKTTEDKLVSAFKKIDMSAVSTDGANACMEEGCSHTH